MPHHRLCPLHRDLHDHVLVLATTVHTDRRPGRQRQLPAWLQELTDRLELLLGCFRCCRQGDRLGELLGTFLLRRYREHLATMGPDTARNLRRRPYALTPLVRSLATDPARALLDWPGTGCVDTTPGGVFEQHLLAHGEDLSLLAVSFGLGAHVARTRGLAPHLWCGYTLSVHDAGLLATLGPDPGLRRFGSHPVQWLSPQAELRSAVLTRLGWTSDLDRAARETLAVLVTDWHGSIDDAIDTARRLG